VNQCAGEADLLVHTRAVIDDEGVTRICEIEDVQEFGTALPCQLAVESVQSADVLEQLRSSQPVEQRQPIGEHTQQAFGRDRVGPYVMP
jgi:hypothetical protein